VISTAISCPLTEVDLEKLGVSLGHRKRLLRAISGLAATDTLAVPFASTGAKAHDAAERRQLTVMFCDLVGSTALAAGLDPEDLREVIAAYHRAVANAVRNFDGFVAKYMGDGVLVYFGYPHAHEDDAERAVRAALGVISAVVRLDVRSVKLQARVGIATGLVIVGDLIGEGSAQEQSVVGETPNLAARLQVLAEPDAVIIAAGTGRLLGDLLEYSELGAVEVKGLAAPVLAWRVLGPSVVASRFEALRGLALSPLVGRDEEIELLMRRWARAKASNGQVVLISGEPGIGKSRLAEALADRLRASPHLRLRYFCSPYHQDSALYPFIDQLGRAAEFARDDPPAARLEKLEALLALAAPPDVALLAELMSLPPSERHPLPDLSPQRKKERTLEALVHQLEGLARQHPVVMIFEDAHWIDPTSRELLDLTIERARSLPVLLIVTFRPEFQPPWTGQSQVTMLALNRLDRRDRTTLVEQITGCEALPDELIAQIAERTDGVPLFIEELTKSVLERGVGPVGIPATLHDSLMARLDRLASVRRVAQIGAAIGRDFSYTLLQAVSSLPEEELHAALGRLTASELVFQRGAPPEAVYSFKHALVQDAAHGSLLRNVRQQLHAQIAEALETHSPELMDTQPELFAQHYAEAGLVEKAVIYWGKAGRRSAARSAMTEAAAQFQKGLDQLALLPDTPERLKQDLEFLNSRGAALYALKGPGAPEMGLAYARGLELWTRVGSPAEFINVAYGRLRYLLFSGELASALGLAEDLLRLSHERDDPAGLVQGHFAIGRTLMFIGRFGPARFHLEKSLSLYNKMRSAIYDVGAMQIGLQVYSAIVLVCLGYPDQALSNSAAATVEARGLDPISLATSMAMRSRLLSLVGDDMALGEQADQLVSFTIEQGFRQWHAQGTIYRGWVQARNGHVAEGMPLLRDGITAFRASGTEAWLPHFLALRASACDLAGEAEEGLSLLDEATQIVDRTGERWLEAELYRLRGQLLLRRGHAEAAENSYREALRIAREQEAKLWELRAAASLARLCRDRGHRGQVRDLLAPLYGWFTEGFGTADLKEARALLDELSAR
jgi:class 3 adenylate cyclase/tetratricopeptide (TPR) repeat protein